MKTNSYNNDILQAIKASIENHEWCCKNEDRQRNLLYGIKYIIWYLLLIIISPYRKITSSKMVCATTVVNEFRLTSYVDNGNYFCFAKLNGSIRQMIKNNSVLSPYKFLKRIQILIDAIKFYINYNKELKGYFHFTLEYYSIAYYIANNNIQTIVSPCMYDRYSTFFSYYAYVKSIKLIGVQDGAAIDISVPKKIYCDQMYCFDEYEAEIIKKFTANNDCKFSFTGFTSAVKWDTFNLNNKFTVGIASQDWYTSKTIDLLDRLLYRINEKKASINVVLYPHYREKLEIYNGLKQKYPDLIIEQTLRHSNIDLLVTFYSTIVYDFWSINPNLEVRCLKIEDYEPGYYGRFNVDVYDNIDKLIENILDKHRIEES